MTHHGWWHLSCFYVWFAQGLSRGIEIPEWKGQPIELKRKSQSRQPKNPKQWFPTAPPDLHPGQRHADGLLPQRTLHPIHPPGMVIAPPQREVRGVISVKEWGSDSLWGRLLEPFSREQQWQGPAGFIAPSCTVLKEGYRASHTHRVWSPLKWEQYHLGFRLTCRESVTTALV